jgi:hypothetical protein
MMLASMAKREQTRSLLAAKLHIFPEIRRLAARNLSNPTDFLFRLSQYVKEHVERAKSVNSFTGSFERSAFRGEASKIDFFLFPHRGFFCSCLASVLRPSGRRGFDSRGGMG